MELDIKLVLELYKEEIAKLQNENILLKAEIIQMRQNEKNEAVQYSEDDE